jgi:outer membrane beta-barrel protein
MCTLNTSKNLLALSCIFAFASVAVAQGKSAPKAPPPAPAAKASPTEDKKVDISDLENKYWAPKDTDFSVVQNRTYSKEHKFFLSPQYGMPINDQHSEGSLYGLSANYFWSERYGVQLSYLRANLKNNEATRDLRSFASGVQPNHGRMNSYYGVGFNYVPFYAKMSFMGHKIIYFDMAVTPTVGYTVYDQILEHSTPTKGAFTYGIDITQYFFFSKWFAIRADLKNQWYSQEIRSYYNNNVSHQVEGQKIKDKFYHDSLFLVGVTLFW